MPLEVASLEARLGLNKDDFDKGLASAKGSFGGFGKALAGVGAVGVAGVAAVAGGVTAAGVAAVNVSNDLDTALDGVAASLGISRDEAAKYEEGMKGIFANNFGENFEDIGEAIATVQREMSNLSPSDVEKVTQGALALRDTFGADVSETVDAASSLMNQFGITSEQALDFVAKGLQDIPADDFLDTVREYSNVFAEGGFSAGQMFDALQQGVQGGVLGTDKIADAFKEFGVIMAEVSDDTLESMGILLGDEATDEIFRGLQDGTVSLEDAFQQVSAAIADIENPINKNSEAIRFFGTAAEDLGASFVDNLDIGATAIEDLAGSTDILNEKYTNLGSATEGFKRQALVALEPIGEVLLDLVNKATPFVSEFLDRAAPLLDTFAGRLAGELPDAMGRIGDAIGRIAEVFGIAEEGATGLDGAIGILDATLNAILGVIDLVATGMEKVAEAMEIAKGLGEQLGQINDLVGQGVGAEKGQGLFGREGALNILGFADGGIVPGATGAAVPAIVHGGEEIIPVGGSRGGANITMIVQGSINGDDHLRDVLASGMNQLAGMLQGAS